MASAEKAIGTRRRKKRIRSRTRVAAGAIAGAMAGCLTTAALHPIDTVKTQMQLQTRGYCSPMHGPLHCFMTLMKAKGIASVYAGFRAAAGGAMISSALYFGAYEWAKTALPMDWPARMAIAAVFGNAVSSTMLVPKELIKQRLQAGATGGAFHVARTALRRDGIRGLYVGYGTTLLRNAPSNAVNFSLFEWIKARRLEHTRRPALAPWESFLAGLTSGGCSSFLTTPMDVAKTRLMTQQSAKSSLQLRASGLLATLATVAKEDGPLGLYRGAVPRAVHGAAFGALGFLAFETCKRALFVRMSARVAHEGEADVLVARP